MGTEQRTSDEEVCEHDYIYDEELRDDYYEPREAKTPVPRNPKEQVPSKPKFIGGPMTAGDLLQAAIALLREWGTTYADPRFPQWPPYGERIQEFLARADSRSDETTVQLHAQPGFAVFASAFDGRIRFENFTPHRLEVTVRIVPLLENPT